MIKKKEITAEFKFYFNEKDYLDIKYMEYDTSTNLGLALDKAINPQDYPVPVPPPPPPPEQVCKQVVKGSLYNPKQPHRPIGTMPRPLDEAFVKGQYQERINKIVKSMPKGYVPVSWEHSKERQIWLNGLIEREKRYNGL